jgi:hypothetical protein
MGSGLLPVFSRRWGMEWEFVLYHPGFSGLFEHKEPSFKWAFLNDLASMMSGDDLVNKRSCCPIVLVWKEQSPQKEQSLQKQSPQKEQSLQKQSPEKEQSPQKEQSLQKQSLQKELSPQVLQDLHDLAEFEFLDADKPGRALTDKAVQATRALIEELVNSGAPEPADLAPYQKNDSDAVLLVWEEPAVDVVIDLKRNAVLVETPTERGTEQWPEFNQDGVPQLIKSIADFVLPYLKSSARKK